MSSIRSTRRRTLALLIVLSLGHVLLISTQVQTRSGLPALEAAAFAVFAGIQGSAAGIAGGTRGFFQGWIALRGVEAENEALRGQVAELQGRVQGLEAIARTTAELEEALGLRSRVSLETLAARVIAGNPVPGMLTVTIDRGAADGVRSNMAVIAADGVVGRIIGEPAAHAAEVQLLVGRNAGAGATLERSGAGGMIVGGHQNGPPLVLEYVPNLVDVQPGERVFTSGQDGIYPPGFVIGTVEGVEIGSPYREITVRPAIDVSHLEIVLVVLAPPAPAGGAGR
jgi:rod shape-determining protein MreC